MEARLLSSPVAPSLAQIGFSKNIAGTQSLAIARSSEGKRQGNDALICRSSYDHEAMKRREVLLGSSMGAAGLPFLLNNPWAFASPVQPPDLNLCQTSSSDTDLNCCLPKTTKAVKDYILPANPKVRHRPAAHLADPEYIEKYSRAYTLLRNLPDSDPRKQINQGYIHCVFCDGRLVQPGTQNPFNVHYSWIFLPWHRWYLYFHERILQNLLGDDDFRLPFWNWDNQSDDSPLPNTMPVMYTTAASLYDAKRNTLHQPPAIADLSWAPGSPERQGDLATLRRSNNAVMYQQMVSGAKTARLFMGEPYRAEDPDPTSAGEGSLEGNAHGFVHVWSGGNNAPFEDMGALYSAALDPIFFAHHANVDRLWWIWKTRLNRQEFTDSDWLDAAFVFFDENGDPVKVKVRDGLDVNQLGYTYQNMPLTWLTSKSTTSAAASSGVSKLKGKKVEVPEFGNIKAGKSQKLASPFSSKVKYPPAKVGSLASNANMAMAHESSGSEVVLLIQGVEFSMHELVGFDVFINLPGADSSTSLDVIEYAGSFLHLPHMKKGSENMTRTTTVRLGIGETLQDLGIKAGESFDVTLVPRNGGEKIIVKGFDVEYQ